MWHSSSWHYSCGMPREEAPEVVLWATLWRSSVDIQKPLVLFFFSNITGFVDHKISSELYSTISDWMFAKLITFQTLKGCDLRKFNFLSLLCNIFVHTIFSWPLCIVFQKFKYLTEMWKWKLETKAFYSHILNSYIFWWNIHEKWKIPYFK